MKPCVSNNLKEKGAQIVALNADPFEGDSKRGSFRYTLARARWKPVWPLFIINQIGGLEDGSIFRISFVVSADGELATQLKLGVKMFR